MLNNATFEGTFVNFVNYATGANIYDACFVLICFIAVWMLIIMLSVFLINEDVTYILRKLMVVIGK